MEVRGLVNVAQIGAGLFYTCARLVSGRVDCWGVDWGSSRQPAMRGRVETLDDAEELAVGGMHACVRRSSGTVVCWGSNDNGQLGNETTISSSLPVAVLGLAGVEIAAGESHTCALLATGDVACWGSNDSGQLGDGTLVDRAAPVVVKGL